MKYSIPEISWHNRDPVLSVDFQPKLSENEPFRLATGGTDSHVVIWHLEKTDSGSINIETAADLTRHQKAVNIVRWSPSGEYLASGDDESIIFIWKKADKDPVTADGDEQYKESWIIHKTLRGHTEDVLDLSWSPCSGSLCSGSVDNRLLVWDVGRARSAGLPDHKGFVQGVAWDPRGQYIVSASSDRVFRAFDIASKKVCARSSKAPLGLPGHAPDAAVRLYHDDTLQTYFRRLAFSPDGRLVAVPAGRIEPDQAAPHTKPINAVYIYSRYNFKVPAVVLPCGESPALCCRWTGGLRARAGGPKPMLPLPERAVLAVATRRALLLYDTQQRTPIALISHIHYTRLTDLSWSSDGLTLIASSTDGFCSFVTFSPGELGTPTEKEPEITKEEQKNKIDDTSDSKEVETKPESQDMPRADQKPTINLDSFIKIKAPKKRSPKSDNKKDKTPVKVDILEEVAMASWSDNSQSEIIRHQAARVLEAGETKADPEKSDSQDLQLFYEETEDEKNASHDDVEMRDVSKHEDVSMRDSEAEFLLRARVTDAAPTQAPDPAQAPVSTSAPGPSQALPPTQAPGPAPSPKAPRRVNFVTLSSSPKNSKKKL